MASRISVKWVVLALLATIFLSFGDQAVAEEKEGSQQAVDRSKTERL